MGAMLRILLHLAFRSSMPTMPLTREPTGSPALLMRTQALSSNRTTEPSLRWTLYFVRTTMAWRISPRLTLLEAASAAAPSLGFLRCSWTTTTMRSPGNRQRFACRMNGKNNAMSVSTYRCVPLLADDQGALDQGGARVVDAVEHRLCGIVSFETNKKIPIKTPQHARSKIHAYL